MSGSSHRTAQNFPFPPSAPCKVLGGDFRSDTFERCIRAPWGLHQCPLQSYPKSKPRSLHAPTVKTIFVYVRVSVRVNLFLYGLHPFRAPSGAHRFSMFPFSENPQTKKRILAKKFESDETQLHSSFEPWFEKVVKGKRLISLEAFT